MNVKDVIDKLSLFPDHHELTAATVDSSTGKTVLFNISTISGFTQPLLILSTED